MKAEQFAREFKVKALRLCEVEPGSMTPARIVGQRIETTSSRAQAILSNKFLTRILTRQAERIEGFPQGMIVVLATEFGDRALYVAEV